EKASMQLLQLGSSAEEELRKVLAGKPSLEVRRRGEKLLAWLAGNMDRDRCAVEVLEWINSAAVRKLLKTLAQGDGEAMLTQETQASLERLGAVTKPRP